jgi:glycosyltransferase involved in cell wall biosynthesis
MTGRELRVLVLCRSYPNNVFPTLGLWVEQPTVLLSRQFDVRVVSPVPWCPPLPNEGPFEQYARFRRILPEEYRNGVEVVRPRFLVGPGSSTYMLEARSMRRAVLAAAGRLHRERPIDLIHAHFMYPEGVVAHAVAQRLAVPFVVTEHAPWTGWLDRPGVARQALPAARAAEMLMPVSTSVERTIRQHAGEAARTQVVPVGVDGERFRPSNGARQNDRLLFVGFINYMKGVDVLLRAMRLLADRGSSARLTIVGGAHYRNTAKQERELRALAATLQLEDRVTFVGRRPPDEVARLMGESAALVLPSRAESFGAVLIEALACGTPVVATACGGPEDIVTPGVGHLVRVGDVEHLAHAISEVVGARRCFDPASLRAYALDRFRLDRIADQYAEIYRGISAR